MKCYVALVALGLALAGCTTTPVHYHTLVAPGSFDKPVSAPARFKLQVMPVTVPAGLDQAYLTLRKGETGVEILDNERWASPPGNEIRMALSEALTSRLDADDVSYPSDLHGEPVVQLRVEIRRLDAWPGSHVQLVAKWSVMLSTRQNLPLTCTTSLREKAMPDDQAGMAGTQQAAIQHLADVIAENIAAFANSGATGCVNSTRAGAMEMTRGFDR